MAEEQQVSQKGSGSFGGDGYDCLKTHVDDSDTCFIVYNDLMVYECMCMSSSLGIL